MSKPPSKRSIATKADILRILDGDPTPDKLNDALSTLAQWRSALLQNTLTAQSGDMVRSGPFAGMLYNTAPTGRGIARLLGCYEATLAPVLEHIIASAPPLIIDIGCSDGFYSVGLARRLRDATIWARDADPAALEAVHALADLNEVPNQVKTGGKLTHADFDICRAQATTILCDIGGSEEALATVFGVACVSARELAECQSDWDLRVVMVNRFVEAGCHAANVPIEILEPQQVTTGFELACNILISLNCSFEYKNHYYLF